MAYVLVVIFSLLVGGAVYGATIRAGREGPAAVGFEGADARRGDLPQMPFEPPGPGYTYLRVATRGPSWQDRVQGVVGLIILVVVAAAGLAFGIYQLGHIVNSTIERFLSQ